MCPATYHHLSRSTLEGLVHLVSVGLHGSAVSADEPAGGVAAPGAHIIMEVDAPAHGIPHGPHVSLHRTVLLVVDHRQRAFIHLYVVLLHYLLPEFVVQQPQFRADSGEPVIYRRIAQHDAQFLVFLYLTVERQVIGVLVYEDVRQKAFGGHPLRDYHFRQRSYLERRPVGILHLEAALEDELVACDSVDVHLSGPDGQPVRVLHTYLHIVRIVFHPLGIDVGDYDGKVGVYRLADLALVCLDFYGLGVLLLHGLDFGVKSGLLILAQLLVEQSRLKSRGVERKVLLAHLAEELLAEPVHHGLQGGHGVLEFGLLGRELLDLCLKPFVLLDEGLHILDFHSIKVRKKRHIRKSTALFIRFAPLIFRDFSRASSSSGHKDCRGLSAPSRASLHRRFRRISTRHRTPGRRTSCGPCPGGPHTVPGRLPPAEASSSCSGWRS